MYCFCFSVTKLGLSLWPHGLYPARHICLLGSPSKNIRVGCYSLLQEIFPIEELNLGLLHWQADSLPLSHLGSLYHVYKSVFILLQSFVITFYSPYSKNSFYYKSLAFYFQVPTVALSITPNYLSIGPKSWELERGWILEIILLYLLFAKEETRIQKGEMTFLKSD